MSRKHRSIRAGFSGSVFRAVEAGYSRIGIVDGNFGNVPSVWHKEILYGMSSGVEILGAGSMGALRAAELHEFGMIGVGTVFRLFRAGFWTDDDELAVIHATEEFGYRPLSEAMANIRFTLRKLRQSNQVSHAVERELISVMKSRHFAERTIDELARQAEALIGKPAGQRLVEDFARAYVDVKKRDARALIATLMRTPPARRQQKWRFPRTAYWTAQFETNIADVPILR